MNVSVIIPLHNCEPTIRRCMLSLVNQTYKDFLVIAVDNNCDDKTMSIVTDEFSDRLNIKIVSCKLPGIVPALNTGLRAVPPESSWVARQDGDDYWYPEKLEKQISFLNENKDVHILGTQCRLLDEAGNVEDVGTFGRKIRYPISNTEIKSMILMGQNPVCHPSVVFHKDIMNVLGGYEQLYPMAEDLHIWARAIPHFTFANLPDVLVDYTQKKSPDYDARVPLLISDTYYNLYKQTGIVTGEREERIYDWQREKDGHKHGN
jgi:glycosyltransferase involved in cell wall biosynthesis